MNKGIKDIHCDLRLAICKNSYMLCPNCVKLAFLHTNKSCIRCQGVVLNNVSVLCDFCSANSKQCSVCLKKVISEAERVAHKGCNCGKK